MHSLSPGGTKKLALWCPFHKHDSGTAGIFQVKSGHLVLQRWRLFFSFTMGCKWLKLLGNWLCSKETTFILDYFLEICCSELGLGLLFTTFIHLSSPNYFTVKCKIELKVFANTYRFLLDPLTFLCISHSKKCQLFISWFSQSCIICPQTQHSDTSLAVLLNTIAICSGC